MMPVLLAVVLLQVIPAASMLTVRGTGGAVAVPIVQGHGGRAVQLDRVGAAVPVQIEDVGDGRHRITFAGIDFTVTEQSPYMQLGGRVVPLASAPWMEDGHLFLPLQAFTDQLPRIAPDQLRYDPGASELRVLAAGASVPGEGAGAGNRRGGVMPSDPRRVARRGPHAGRLTERRVVVVDAGHGGPDRGMRGPLGGGPRIFEKDITLAVAQRLAAALRGRGISVVMTRTRDTLIALSDRGRIANQHEGDLFISVHVNAANMGWHRPQDARGFETYFLSEAKTEDARRVEQMENESVRFETGANAPKDDPLSFVINDMAQNEHLRESDDLASTIQRRLGAIHPGPDRGVKQANFAVLRTSFMPAVLVEIGFGTNAAEARYLSEPARQDQIAEAMATATVEYLQRYERRVGVAGR
jgi:N-acetylmuramoyl-L-alanine amidase